MAMIVVEILVRNHHKVLKKHSIYCTYYFVVLIIQHCIILCDCIIFIYLFILYCRDITLHFIVHCVTFHYLIMAISYHSVQEESTQCPKELVIVKLRETISLLDEIFVLKFVNT